MNEDQDKSLGARVQRALNRVAKWRTVYVSWQLGTRIKGDPEAAAVRDAAEQRIMQRVELSALASLLIKKGVFTIDEFNEELIIEAAALEKALERRFPGFKAQDNGMDVNLALARDTMHGWLP
jgi:hypothetical protein